MNAFISSSLYLWLLSDLEYTLIYDKIIINLIFLKKDKTFPCISSPLDFFSVLDPSDVQLLLF